MGGKVRFFPAAREDPLRWCETGHSWRSMGPDDILPTYDRLADRFDAARDRTLFERPWLDRFLAFVPPPRRVLDLGCGTGLPIARYLVERRAELTGVDGAARMVALFEQNLPAVPVLQARMQDLDLSQRFEGVLAWDSFFHLSLDDQRAMFRIFAAHVAPGGALMFNTGPKAGEAWGTIGSQAEGAEVYHASFDPETYRAFLEAAGFDVLRYAPEDAQARGRTLWLARRRDD
jgi:trans-aconitate methyltransferase